MTRRAAFLILFLLTATVASAQTGTPSAAVTAAPPPTQTPAMITPEATDVVIAPVATDTPPDVIIVPMPAAPATDDYAKLISLLKSIVETLGGAAVVIVGMWKGAPVLLAVLEVGVKFTARKEDDEFVAFLRRLYEQSQAAKAAAAGSVTVTVDPTADSASTTFSGTQPPVVG